MKLYNTLTRQIDPIVPLRPPQIGVYTCGPTVYDYAHIGHWFNYVRMDTLIRVLKLSGFSPTWVMNITDVGHLVSDADDGEDKLEKGARREGKTAWEVAAFYTADFLECLSILHITTPDHITKATDHISEQISLIEQLEAKGFTYTISDGVYYDTSRFEGYAAFARLDLDGQQAGARVELNNEKRNPTDFALWKFSPTISTIAGTHRDMEWESPWGVGFPGWHIECSAMSMKYLGDILDIHTGGIDHIPVHHTNEIAQSEAATGKRFALHWMHSNHLLVDGHKISKSLGNGIRLQTLLGEGFTADAIRLYVMESGYRTQSQFTRSGLQSAQSRLQSLQAMADRRFQQTVANQTHELADDVIEAGCEAFVSALKDDLNTPAALAVLSQIENQISARTLSDSGMAALLHLLETVDGAMGLTLLASHDITDLQKQLLVDRQQARDRQQWPAADKLRDTLSGQGIAVRDTAWGQVWSRL